MEYIALWERDSYEKGEKSGEKRGEKRGEKIWKKKIAQNLLSLGVEIEKIAQATGLKKGEIKKLAATSH